MNLETLVLELVADDSKLSRDIDAAVNKATKKLASLESAGGIAPKVNFKELHDLNKLLDVKQRHIRQTVKVFNDNPITVRVNTAEVAQAKSEIAALRGELKGMSTKVKAEVTHRFEGQKANNDRVVNALLALNSLMRQSVKNTAKPSGVGGAIKGVVNAAISTPMTVVKGALMGFGQDVVKDFSVGFKKSINEQFSSKIGSTELLGKRFATHVSDNLSSVFVTIGDAIDEAISDMPSAQNVKNKLQNKLENIFVSAEAVEENLVQAANRAQAKKQRTSKVKQGKKEYGLELADQSAAAQQQYQQGLMQYQKLSKQAKPRIVKAQEEAAKIAGESVIIQSQIDKRKNEGDVWGEVPELENKLRVNDAKIKQLTDYANDLKDGLIQRAEQLEYLEKKASELSTKAGKYLQSFVNDSVMEDNIKTVMQDLGIKQPKQMPTVVAKKNAKAHATYNAMKNEITVSPELYQRMQSPDFGTVESDSTGYRVLAHEVTHADDFNYGSNQGIASLAKGRSKGGSSGATIADALTITGNNSVHGFLKNYRNKPEYAKIKSAEFYAEMQAKQLEAQKFGIQQVNPFDVAKGKLGSAQSNLSNLSKVAKSNPLLKGIQGQVESLSETYLLLESKIKELDRLSQVDYLSVDDSVVDEIKEKIFKTIGVISQFESSIANTINNAENTLKASSSYQTEAVDIESILDDAFNTDDIKKLQQAKKRIAVALKAINADKGLSQDAKSVLVSEFVNLQKKAKIDTRTANIGASDLILNPMEAMQVQMEKSALAVSDKAVELVHAFVDPIVETSNNVMQLAAQVASDPTKTLTSAGSAIVKAGNQGIRSVAPVISNAYGVASGIENAALSILPYGHLAKKGLQVGAVTMGLPMVAASIPALAPLAGLLGTAGHLGGAAAGGLAASQMGGIASIPMIGGQVAGLLGGAASGLGTVVAEMGAAAIAVNAVSVGAKALVGTALEPQTKQQLKSLRPAQDEVKKATAKKASKLIERAQNLDAYLPTLPESQRKLIGEYLPKAASIEQANKGDFIPQSVALPGLKQLKPADFKQLDAITQSNVKSDWENQYQAAQKVLFEFMGKMRGTIDPLDRMKGDIASLSSAFKAQVKRLEKQGKQLGFDVSKHKMDESAFKGVTLDADAVAMPDVSKLKRDAEESAQNIGNGIKLGTQQSSSQAGMAMVELAEIQQDAYDKTMGIESPSKWAMERMRFIAEGFRNGAKSFKSWVMGDGEDMAESFISGFDNEFDGFDPFEDTDITGFDPSVIESDRRAHFERLRQRDMARVARLPESPPLQDEERINHFERLQNYDKFYDDAIKTLAEIDSGGIDDYNNALQSLYDNANKTLDALTAMGLGASEEAQAMRDLIDLTSINNQAGDNSIKGSGTVTYGLEMTGNQEIDAIIADALESSEKVQKAMDEFDDPNPVRKIKMLFEQFAESNPILQSVIGKFDEFTGSIKKFGMLAVGGLGLAVMAKGLFDVGRGALEAYRNIEGVFIASKLLPGSEVYIKNLRQQAIQLGSDLQSTLEQGIQFSAALVGTPLEAMSQQMFQDASTALSYMGLQQQQYDSALLALKQVASKGRVSLEEITGQLGEAVPGIMPIVADALGTNVQGAIQQIESGNVLAEDLLPKLVAGMRNRTAGLAPAYERSLTAAQGRLGTSMQELNVGIGERLAPAVIPAINVISEVIIGLGKNINALAEAFKLLAVGLTGNVLVALGGLATEFIRYNGLSIKAAFSTKALAGAFNVLKLAAKPLLIALAAIAVFESLNFAFNFKGDQAVLDSIKSVDMLISKVKELRLEEEKRRNANNQPSGFDPNNQKTTGLFSDNPMLGFFDRINFTRFFGGTTFGDIAFDKNIGLQKELSSKINETFSSGSVSNIFNAQSLDGYLTKLIDIDRQIDILQGKSTALRMVDAKANSDEIESIAQQINELNNQRNNLNQNFLPLGIDGINQVIDNLKAQIDFFTTLRLSAESAGDKERYDDATQSINELKSQLGLAERAAKIYDERMQALGNTLNAQRLKFIELSAAIAQSNVALNDTLNQQRAALTDSQVSRGLQTQVNQFEDLSFAVYEAQKRLEILQRTLADQKAYIASNVIDPEVKTTIEVATGKNINNLNAGDIERLRLLAENDTQGRLKTAYGQVQQTLEGIVQTNSQVIEAGRNLADAKKALAEFELTKEDYFRNTARQIEDLNFEIESQQIQDQRSLQDLGFQLQDASVSLRRSNRALREAYQDMAFDFNVQVETISKSINDAQDQLKLTQLRIENLSITPGNSGSIARQINDILLSYTESAFNNDANERQIKIDILNLERERVQRLRQIREFEENQMDATRDFNRQIITLGRAFFDLERNMKQAARDFVRSIQDMTIEMRRTDNSSARGRGLIGQLNAVPNYNPAMVIPTPTRSMNQSNNSNVKYGAGDIQGLKDFANQYGGFAGSPDEIVRPNPRQQSGQMQSSLQGNELVLKFGVNPGEIELGQTAQLGQFLGGLIDAAGYSLEGVLNKKPKTLLEFARFYTRNNKDMPGLSGLNSQQLVEASRQLANGLHNHAKLQEHFNNAAKLSGFTPVSRTRNSQSVASNSTNRTTPQPVNPANVAIPMAQRVNLAKHYMNFYDEAHQLNLQPTQLQAMAKALAEYRSSDKQLQKQFERYVNLSDAERRSVAVEMQKIKQQNTVAKARTEQQSKQSRALGTQAIRNGKPVYWAGDKWGWQSKDSYNKLQGIQPPKPVSIPQPPQVSDNITYQQNPYPFTYQESPPLPPEFDPIGYYESGQDTMMGGYMMEAYQPVSVNPLLAQVAHLDKLNDKLSELKRLGIDAQARLNVAQLIDSYQQFVNTTKDGLESTKRSVHDTDLSVKQLISSSKGWLTITQKVNQVGQDTASQYDNQIRSINDSIQDITRLTEGREMALASLEALAKSAGYTEEQKDEELSNLENTYAQYEIQRQLLITSKSQLENTKAIAVANAKNRAYLQEQLNYLDKMAGLMGSISSARFDLGGSLINEAPILQARMQLETAVQRATAQGQADGLDGQDLANYVALSKELAEVNYQKSFADAIPFVKELGANLKEAVFETGNFTEAFSKLLRVMASEIFDRLVLMPFTNGLSQFIGNVFGLGQQAIPALNSGQKVSTGGSSNFFTSAASFVGNLLGGAFAGGLDQVMGTEQSMTGRKPMLAVVNEGEAILSTLNGDAQKFQALKRSGVWDEIPNYANGADKLYNQSRNYRGNWSVDSLLPSAQTRQTISNQRSQTINKFNQNYTIVTPNADSFRKSQSQIQDEGARTYRRKMR